MAGDFSCIVDTSMCGYGTCGEMTRFNFTQLPLWVAYLLPRTVDLDHQRVVETRTVVLVNKIGIDGLCNSALAESGVLRCLVRHRRSRRLRHSGPDHGRPWRPRPPRPLALRPPSAPAPSPYLLRVAHLCPLAPSSIVLLLSLPLAASRPLTPCDRPPVRPASVFLRLSPRPSGP